MGNQLRHDTETTYEVPLQLHDKNNLKADSRAAEAYIPQDLITEILLCSSAKSLLRFRCVSKYLCTFIDGKQFVYLHHNRSVENKERRKLIIRESRIGLHVVDVDTGLEEKIKEPYKKSPKPYGYCNGLILFLRDSFKPVIWNPSTKQYRNLPRCPIEVPKGGSWSTIGMGLGYDSTRDEYKVVLIEDVMTDNNTHNLQLWIFGLRSNSWKKIQNFPCGKNKFIYFGYFADDYLHWLCKPSEEEYVLVTFDVAREKICSSERLRQCPKIDLHVLDGCLCISYLFENPKEVVCYARKKEGTKLFWIKLFSISPEMPLLFNISRFKNMRVLGYSKGDRIMVDLGFNFIVSYDPKDKGFTTTKTRKSVDVDPVDPGRLWNYPFFCHESLVSVGGGDLSQISGKKRKNMIQDCLQQPIEIEDS